MVTVAVTVIEANAVKLTNIREFQNRVTLPVRVTYSKSPYYDS